MKGKRIAVLEARLGKQLAELVEQRGGVPFHAPALAELPDLDAGAIAKLVQSLGERAAKVAIFQTGVGTRALFAVAQQLGKAEPLRAGLNATLVASIGPVASAALRDAQVTIGVEARPPKLGALLTALEAALN